MTACLIYWLVGNETLIKGVLRQSGLNVNARKLFTISKYTFMFMFNHKTAHFINKANQITDDQNIHSIIPLSHYSRNAPRIHNVGHFIQIAKVPSGVCKSRPAFVLDSATFVAIAKCSQTQLRVGNLFHFPQNS